jgi:hypothetical protein
MVACLLGASAVDAWVARQQRRQLGLCEKCGGVYEAASCSQQGCPLASLPKPSSSGADERL